MLTGTDDHGQCTTNGLKGAVQRQFAQQQHLGEIHLLQLGGGHEHTDGNGQVKGRPFLFHVRRCQIHGDPCHRHGKAGIDNGGTDPVTAFLHGSIRQADDFQYGQTGSGIDFHLDGEAIDTA